MTVATVATAKRQKVCRPTEEGGWQRLRYGTVEETKRLLRDRHKRI